MELSDPAKFEEVIGHAAIALPDARADMIEALGDDEALQAPA